MPHSGMRPAKGTLLRGNGGNDGDGRRDALDGTGRTGGNGEKRERGKVRKGRRRVCDALTMKR